MFLKRHSKNIYVFATLASGCRGVSHVPLRTLLRECALPIYNRSRLWLVLALGASHASTLVHEMSKVGALSNGIVFFIKHVNFTLCF